MKIAQYLPSKIYQEDPTSLKADDSKRKLLPHIVGEYEYRITNKLLVQKIMKPRRDRIIM